jgi:hypothetical protein
MAFGGLLSVAITRAFLFEWKRYNHNEITSQAQTLHKESQIIEAASRSIKGKDQDVLLSELTLSKERRPSDPELPIGL